MFLPSRTCRAIHQDTGGTWLYQGQSVRSEWQFPQARTKTCAGSELNESGVPTFPGLRADRRSISTCPTITAMAAANAKIGLSALIIESYCHHQPFWLPAILRPSVGTNPETSGGIFARCRLRQVFQPNHVSSTSVPIWTPLSIRGHSERRHPNRSNRQPNSIPVVSKMLPGGEAGYGCKNRKPRYRHNPDHWLGGNHHCYGIVLNCHRDKHYGMPGKSTLNHVRNFLDAVPACAVL